METRCLKTTHDAQLDRETMRGDGRDQTRLNVQPQQPETLPHLRRFVKKSLYTAKCGMPNTRYSWKECQDEKGNFSWTTDIYYFFTNHLRLTSFDLQLKKTKLESSGNFFSRTLADRPYFAFYNAPRVPFNQILTICKQDTQTHFFCSCNTGFDLIDLDITNLT